MDPRNTIRTTARLGATRQVSLALLGLIILSSAGCATSRWAERRSQPLNPLTERLQLLTRRGPQPTLRTTQLLRRYDLLDDLRDNPQIMMTRLHQKALQEPTLENVYAMSELAYLSGKNIERSNKNAALDLYGEAVLQAYLYLFDTRFDSVRNPYDPQYRGASEIYNTALESAMRIVHARGELRPGCTHTIKAAGVEMDVTVVLHGDRWHEEDFDGFEFVSDFKTAGLTNHYKNHGLGVPLIAIRKPQTDADADAAEQFYPPDLSFPVTAFLRLVKHRPSQDGEVPGRMEAILELYDPLDTTETIVADRLVPLETDISTPLAYFLDQPHFRDSELSTLGLLQPDKAASLRGLYMLEPFQEHKIPVILVHGLWSSPVTWMQMYNDLRADREIRDNYQFWFYLYPTGQSFWISSRKMKEDLLLVRSTLDPQHQHPALGQSVLIGHSMGGLIARLQSIDSGDAFWRIMSDRPIEELKAEDEVREALVGTFFPTADVSVRRVITIATPHGGSSFSNDFTRWLGNKLISMPRQFLSGRQRLLRENPGFFDETKLLALNTSIDSLSPESPLLPRLRSEPPAPWIRHHNIVGLSAPDGFLGRISSLGRVTAEGDGVVSLASANLDLAESQITVQADHSSVHQHPRAILEVRRILLDHLAELQTGRLHP